MPRRRRGGLRRGKFDAFDSDPAFDRLHRQPRRIGLERARCVAGQRIGGVQRADGSEPAPSIEHVHLLAEACGIALDPVPTAPA